MKTLLIVLGLLMVCLFSAYRYVRWYADGVAGLVGYFVAIVVFPVAVGTVLGCLAAKLAAHGTSSTWKRYWWLIVLGGTAWLVPLAHLWVAIMFVE